MSRGRSGTRQKVKTAKGRKIGSTRWLERQLNDPYVKQARAEGYRSRAAYKLQSRQKAGAIDAVRAQIEKPFAGNAFAGNPNGDVIVVEYSDFNCPYCKQTERDIAKMIAEDKNVKVVFRELPILSEASNDAALMALAAAKQGKYYAFHKTMFATGRPTPSTIEAAATEVGLDMAAARAFIASPEAKREIENNIAIAQQMRFTGTPAWVVGNQSEVGAIGFDGLKAMIAKARAAN